MAYLNICTKKGTAYKFQIYTFSSLQLILQKLQEE